MIASKFIDPGNIRGSYLTFQQKMEYVKGFKISQKWRRTSSVLFKASLLASPLLLFVLYCVIQSTKAQISFCKFPLFFFWFFCTNMSAVKMFKASLSLLLITFTHGLFRTYNGSGPVSGQTPCCLDRMTTVSCNRLQLLNPNLFLFNCVHSADFAFVQCCKSCFDIKSSFSLNLDYSKIADVLLTNPQTAICNDRRGEEWCERLVKRRNFWGLSRYKQLDCSSMPFAFRVCRKSCGYCSNGSDRVGAIYDIKIATDPSRCNNPSYGLALPRKISENVRKLENRYTKTSTTVTTTEMPTPTTTTEPCTKATTLRPTTTTKNIETPSTTIPDFFVVTDQNYIDADDTQINDFDDWWSKRKGPYYLRLFKNQP